MPTYYFDHEELCMNMEIAYTLQMLIVGIIVYVTNSSFGGFIEAWIAKKVGDSVPEELGYKTIDPAAHFSFFWCALMLAGLTFGHVSDFFRGMPGLGKSVPIAPQALVGRHLKTRIVIGFLGRALAHLFLFILLFFVMIVPLFIFLKSSAAGGQNLALADALQLIAFTFYTQNIYLFNVYLTIGLSRAVLFFYFPDVDLFSLETLLLSFVLFFCIAHFITPVITQGLLMLLMSVGILDFNIIKNVLF